MDSNRERSSRRPAQTARSKHRQSVSLSIRTANHGTPPALQQATPQPQSYPIYPLPIPREKEARALDLYIQYCDAQLKEKVETSEIELQSTASHRGGYHLAVPGPPTAHSVASSSKYSFTTSAYDAPTDFSSVVSFDGEDEPTSAAGRMEGELISFDGNKVKPRRRKKLTPVARAKAALVRHLGSCWVCRSRRVKVSFQNLRRELQELIEEVPFRTPRYRRPRTTPPETLRDTATEGGNQLWLVYLKLFTTDCYIRTCVAASYRTEFLPNRHFDGYWRRNWRRPERNARKSRYKSTRHTIPKRRRIRRHKSRHPRSILILPITIPAPLYRT